MKIKGMGIGGAGFNKRATGSSPMKSASRSGSASRTGGGQGPLSQRDDIAISSDAKLMGVAGEVVHAAPDMRLERVMPIKLLLEDGRYTVTSEQIANEILREALLERGRH